MGTWKLREARARLGELTDRAVDGEPQFITRRGTKVAVIISHDDFERRKTPMDFKEFLLSAPLRGINLRRSRRRPRKLDF